MTGYDRKGAAPLQVPPRMAHDGPVGARKKVRQQLKDLSHKQLKKQVPRDEASAPLGDSYDKGNFTYGYCKSCDWVGSARRARDSARRDALEHAALCSGKHKPRVATIDEKV